MAVNALEKAGFTLAPSVVKPRMIVSVYGSEGSGKTHFAMTAPGPIALLNFDDGTEGVVEKFQSLREDVYQIDLEVPYTTVTLDDGDEVKRKKERELAKLADAEWDRSVEFFRKGLKFARTVVVDTATQWWELLRLARFGRQSNVKHLFTAVNAEFRRIVKGDAFNSDASVVYLHSMKDEYVNDVRTGELVPAGFGGMPYIVQVHLHAHRDENGGAWRLTVDKCRQNGRVVGEEFESISIGEDERGMELTMTGFPFVACQVFEGTDLEDWT